MTHDTADTGHDDDVVVLGDIPTPALRLVTDTDTDTDVPTLPVTTPLPVADLPPVRYRRYTSTQWLSFGITMTAITVLVATIVAFEPPTYLAVAALVAAWLVGSVLIAAEVITERANRRHEYGDMRTTIDRHTAEQTVDRMAGGFDVYQLDLDT